MCFLLVACCFKLSIGLPHPDGQFMFCCKFNGFLADLAAHQEMTHWKGPWSWRPCMNCANLAIRKHGLDAYECGLSSRFSQFVPNDDNAIWSMVDGVQRVGDHFMSTGEGKTKVISRRRPASTTIPAGCYKRLSYATFIRLPITITVTGCILCCKTG